MTSCQCQGIEGIFSDQLVARQLAHYRRKGPSRTTRILIRALQIDDLRGATLLDIGGGVGSIPHLLLAAGMRAATLVEASDAYAAAAKREARRRGLAERLTQLHGDFVALAPQVEAHDVVTLDRVICCYDDLDALLRSSAGKARRLYGVVFPRETWWIRLGAWLLNGVMRLRANPFRVFVHSTQRIEDLLASMGFRRRFLDRTLMWQVKVYAR